jgi:hypothetical protein
MNAIGTPGSLETAPKNRAKKEELPSLLPEAGHPVRSGKSLDAEQKILEALSEHSQLSTIGGWATYQGAGRMTMIQDLLGDGAWIRTADLQIMRRC